MSRIGKKPIQIPDGVAVTKNGNVVLVKGPKGELQWMLPQEIGIAVAGNVLSVVVARNTKRSSALWGLTRAHLANLVDGVTKGFEKKLEIDGIGYRAALEGERLTFALGFSHPVRFTAPPGIRFAVEKNVITVAGIDKALVGETAARIRALKKPEPYKGKGIHYFGEIIRRKQGKKAVASGG